MFFRRYHWNKDGESFKPQGDRIILQTETGTIVFHSPLDIDAGQYQCFAENDFGIATSLVVDVVKAFFENFENPQTKSFEVVEGSSLQLTCVRPNGLPTPTVYWAIQYKTGEMQNIEDPRLTFTPEGSLWFSNVTSSDASNEFYYVCVAKSVYFEETKLGDRISLKISPESDLIPDHPVLLFVSPDQEIVQGERVELFCVFGGMTLHHVSWTKDNTSLKFDDRIKNEINGKSLIILNTTEKDTGSYFCEISQSREPQTSRINLMVNSMPRFTESSESVTAAVDETVTFECEAHGQPKPVIEWFCNGKAIDLTEINFRRTLTSNKMVISNVIEKDTSNYGCKASNSVGYVYKDFVLVVYAKRP